MTLIDRPVPVPVDRPELAVPKSCTSTCGCEPNDPDLVRLRRLMATGMSQREASRLIWAPTIPPADHVAIHEPGTWARGFIRTTLTARLPWLKLPIPTEVS